MGSQGLLTQQVDAELAEAGMTRQDVKYWAAQSMMDGTPSQWYLHQPVRGREGYQLHPNDMCKVVQYLPTPDVMVIVLDVLRGDVCDVVKFIYTDDGEVGFVRRDGLHKLCTVDTIDSVDFVSAHIMTKAESQEYYGRKRAVKEAKIAFALAVLPLLGM